MEMLQGVWKQHLRPRAVVGYGAKIFLPSPPNYVTRSPGYQSHLTVKKYGGFFLHNTALPQCFGLGSREVREMKIKCQIKKGFFSSQSNLAFVGTE